MSRQNFLELADKARAASRFKKARGLYSRLLKQKGMDDEEKFEAFLGLADVERIQGFFPEALRHYQQASRLYKSYYGQPSWDAQVGWALAARACGRHKEALEFLKKALAFYQKEKDLQGQAFTHWALGGTLRIAGDMKGGLKELRTALKMFQSLKEPESIAYTCCALGGIFRMLGRSKDSGRFYREANRRMRNLHDTFGTAYSYCGLGNVERMAGRFKQALPYYKKAEKLYGTIGDRVSYAYTLWSLGTTYKMLGQYTKAHWAFYKADNLFKKTGDTRGRIYTLLGFAEIEYLKGNFRKFLYSYWNPAEELSKKFGYSWENRHVKTLLRVSIFQQFKKIESAWVENERKKVWNLGKKAMAFTDTSYSEVGSNFRAESVPVNWP